MSIIGQGIMLGTFTGNYQTKTVIPNASTQLITPDSGYDALANITITGDSNFTASNIVNGVTIWGITGTYSPSLSSTTVTPNGASFTITPSGTVVGFNQVSVVGDSNLTAANIKSGVTIYGKQGTYAPSLQSKSVTPNAAGFTVSPDSSYYGLSQVVISGNANLTASNIKSGVSIFGITGSYAPALQSKSATPNKNQQIIQADSPNYGLSQVTIAGDSNFIAGNIVNGVVIWGITGNYVPTLDNLTITTPTTTNTTWNPTNDGYAKVDVIGETNFVAGNIKAGVNMWNVTGTYAPALQTKAVTPNAAGFNVTPDSVYYGLSQVTVNGEANLTAANIKSGVSMFGIAGSYAPSLQQKTATPNAAGFNVTPDSSYYGLSKVVVSGDSNFTAANIACGVTIWGVTGTHQGGSTEDLTAEITNYRDLSNTQANTITNIISNLQNKTGTADHTLEDRLLKGTVSSSDLFDYENNRLTSLRGFAFANVYGLKNLTMANITTVPQYCCYYCSNLVNVAMPNITSVGTFAFSNCPNLRSIDLSKVTTLSTNSFRACTNLTVIDLPNATSLTGTYIFAYCTKITDLDIQKATTLGNEFVNGCTNLVNANLPNVTCVGTYSFYNCTNLSNINCPKLANVTNYSFTNCKNLTTFECAGTDIWNYTFSNCTNLTSLTLTNTTAVCNLRYTTAFNNTPIAGGTGNIYVPSSLVASYKAASNWSTYSSRIYAIGS